MWTRKQENPRNIQKHPIPSPLLLLPQLAQTSLFLHVQHLILLAALIGLSLSNSALFLPALVSVTKTPSLLSSLLLGLSWACPHYAFNSRGSVPRRSPFLSISFVCACIFLLILLMLACNSSTFCDWWLQDILCARVIGAEIWFRACLCGFGFQGLPPAEIFSVKFPSSQRRFRQRS